MDFNGKRRKIIFRDFFIINVKLILNKKIFYDNMCDYKLTELT